MGLPLIVTLPQQGKLLAVRGDAGVAVHADFRGRNRGMRGRLDVRMAIAAIETKLPDMERMAIGNRLHGRVADVRGPGRAAIVEHGDRIDGRHHEQGPRQRSARSIHCGRKGPLINTEDLPYQRMPLKGLTKRGLAPGDPQINVWIGRREVPVPVLLV